MLSKTMKSLKVNLSNRIKFNTICLKPITTYRNKNYSELTTDNELEEVKDWLNTEKPKFLCIFFTNNWNPIAKEANKHYEAFTAQPTPFINLRVDTDKHPRVKWFFDNRCEPGFQFFYFGTKVSQFGGSNFDRAKKEMVRIQEHIYSENEDRNRASVEYEMPYYKYEHELYMHGNEITTDPYQTFKPMAFNPYMFGLRVMPFEENYIARRLKK